MATPEIAMPMFDQEPGKLQKVAHEVWRVITLQGFMPEAAPDYLSEHYHSDQE